MRVCGPVSTNWMGRVFVENEETCGLVIQKQLVFEIFCGYAGVARAKTRSFNIALNFENGAAVREFKLRSSPRASRLWVSLLWLCLCAAG